MPKGDSTLAPAVYLHANGPSAHQNEDSPPTTSLSSKRWCTHAPEDIGADDLSAQDAGHAEHSPARVDALSLQVPLQGLGVGAQAQRVKAAGVK